MKTCFKCHIEQPLSEFYKHPQMADGHLNKCKTCAKADTAQQRRDNPELIGRRKLAWARTPKGKEAARRFRVETKESRLVRNKAVWTVNNAIRLGKLKRLPCLVCGAMKVEGHHPDYSAPLDVVWLCKRHHADAHKLALELNRKEVK